MKFGRVVGFDDGYFKRPGRAPLVGVICRGSVMEGVKITEIEVDGDDVTDKILDIITPMLDQLSAVFLYGTVFGGTNVVDMHAMGEVIPTVAVSDRVPTPRFLRAFELRRKAYLVERNPPLLPISTRRGRVHAAWVGLTEGEAKRLIELYQINAKIPEPLRLAHIIAKGVGLFLNG